MVVLVLLAVLAAASGCGEPEPEPEIEELQGAILILLDTVRADNVGCYGHTRPTTPHLDALARKGIRFDQAVASSPWTLPSVAAMLAGDDPWSVLESRRVTRSLVGRFRDAGFTAAAFTEGGYVSKHFGFDLGFDLYEEEEGAVRLLTPGEGSGGIGIGGIERTFSRAGEWLRDHGNERFFLFIHTYEPHTPYTNRDFATNLDRGRLGDVFPISLLPQLQAGVLELTDAEIEYTKALYDGDVLSSDRYLGAFLQLLEELDLTEHTLVVVTSDHGEELNDHYPSYTGDHGHSLRDPLLMVPLIIYDPRHRDSGIVVSAQVRLIDVMPTVTDLLGLPPDRSIDGASLVPMIDGIESEDRIAVASLVKDGPRRVAVRGMGFKLIETIGPSRSDNPLIPPPAPRQLYDLRADPREVDNLADSMPELSASLREVLVRKNRESVSAEETPSLPDAPGLRERLRSLGYIE